MIYRSFCLTCDDSHCISHKTYSLIQDQAVIRTWLRIGLASHGKTLLRNILPCKDTFDPWNSGSNLTVDFFDQRMGIRTSKHFYDQAVLWCQVIGVDRLTCYQCFRIFFHNRSAYQPEFLSCCRIDLCICHFLMPPFRSASYPDIFLQP